MSFLSNAPIPPSPPPSTVQPKISLTLEVSADFYNAVSAAASSRGLSLSKLVTDLLPRILHLAPSDVWFVVDPVTRLELQKILGGGMITAPEKLLARVRAMSSIKMGTVYLHPTEGQLQELVRRAKANGREPSSELKRAFEEVALLVFGHV